MQWFFMPVYYVPRTGRFPHVQSHLGAKSISSFLIVLVFLCTKLISNYPFLPLAVALNLPMASHFRSD